MHRGVLAALVAALCAPTLLGCNGASSEADPPPTPPTTTPPVTTTTPPPPTPPTTRQTAETITPPPVTGHLSLPAAKAFVRFYINAINSSIQAPSSSVVKRLSTRQCITCRGIASSMDKIRQDHGFYHGGDWHVTSMSPIPLQRLARPIIHTAITVTPGVWKRSPTDRERPIKAGKMYIDVHLSWVTSRWLVTEIVSA